MGPFYSLPGWHHVQRIAMAVTGLFLLAGLVPASVAAQPDSNVYYIEETGHSLGGAFLDYWMANDGLTRLGMPVTEPNPSAAGERQYFEYGVLDRGDSDEDVSTADAGRELLAVRHQPMALAAGKRTGAEREAGAFIGQDDGTGVTMEPATTTKLDSDWVSQLATEFETEGGADRFGNPVSDAHFARGKVVQWFADGRIEVWNSADAEATVAPVGKELALLSGVDTAEIAVGDLISISGFALAGGQQVATADEAGSGFADASGGFAPTRIVIPAIGVDAYVEQVGIYDGAMGTPAGPMNVGWYPDISSPGTGTNVVMAGHVDYYTIGPAVFYSLGSLGAGSEIQVTGPDGQGITYAVTGSTVVGADTPAESVLGGGGGETLTLITCGGDFNGVAYDSRTIVYASRI